MSKARILANLISDNAELADGQISVAEVVGAAPLASPTFTGTASGTFSGPLTGNVVGNLTGDVTGDVTAPEIDLTAISSTIADTAVDVFVYDTSLDSDSGAWRKRTQATSWYNETLNTATRGSRKEFPAVAVIVAEATKVTIYDGDDPDLPLWMVFTPFGGVTVGGLRNYLSGSVTLTSISMVNASLAVGSTYTNPRSGIEVIDFILDTGFHITSSELNTTQQSQPISERNTASVVVAYPHDTIINRNVNDVAMTVLPNAPTDAATGLPVPTIAIASDGGVSVIKDDGTVVDWYRSGGTEYSHQVAFDENNSLYVTWGTTNGQERHLSYLDVIPSSDDTEMTNDYYNSYDGVGSQAFGSNGQGILSNNARAFAAKTGRQRLFLLDHNRTNTDTSSVCDITSTYNTGWMNGAIKLATLSDTDDTNITFADKQLIDEPYFNASTGWYFNGSAASGAGSSSGNGWTIAGGKITQSGTGGDIYAVIPVVSGKQYVMQLTFDTTGTSSFSNVSWGFRSLANSGYLSTIQTNANLVGNTANQTEQVFWTSNYTGNIIARVYSGEALSIDNFTVHIAEEDRSVNGNGLQVFGTVTKTAVATGADLVAYSGFSSGNYLQQPYNSDLDFGTGDFSVTFWFNGSGGGNTNLWERGAATGQNFGILTVNGYIYLTGFGANIPIGSPHANAGDASWGHVVLLREAGVWGAYLNGEPVAWAYTNAATLTNTAAVLHLGGNVALTSFANAKKLALMRFSATIPTAAQVAKIYNDEKYLFQENAQATLYGSSDAVTALAHDDTTDLLHVGTSAGRSVFQGLRRVENTTDAVGAAISASNGLVVEE